MNRRFKIPDLRGGRTASLRFGGEITKRTQARCLCVFLYSRAETDRDSCNSSLQRGSENYQTKPFRDFVSFVSLWFNSEITKRTHSLMNRRFKIPDLRGGTA